MKTTLNFKTEKLIDNLKTSMEFYEIKRNKEDLFIIKKYINKRGRPFSVILPKKLY